MSGKVAITHGSSVEFCEATLFDLVDESKESLYGSETDRDLRSACRYATCFYSFFPNEQRGGWGGGGGVRCQPFYFVLFSLSADHERDWPPCKVLLKYSFFGLATNTLNVRNNNHKVTN